MPGTNPGPLLIHLNARLAFCCRLRQFIGGRAGRVEQYRPVWSWGYQLLLKWRSASSESTNGRQKVFVTITLQIVAKRLRTHYITIGRNVV